MNAILLVALSLIWGSEWVLNNQLGDFPRLPGIALRCLIAAVALLLPAIRDRLRPLAIRQNCLLGIGIIAAPVLLSEMASSVSPGLVVLLFALTPLVATLFENRGGIEAAPYLIGGLTGIAFLVRGALSFSPEQGWSVVWILLAVLIVAASMVGAKQWLPGQNLAGAVTIQMLAAAVTIGGFALLRGLPALTWTTQISLSLICLGLAGSAISYLILYRLLCYYRASQITAVQWLIPIVGVLETAVMFRRLPAWDSCAGAALAVVCAVFILRKEKGVPEGMPGINIH
jgi:drug/metabolite transporter (DMT)-like permease